MCSQKSEERTPENDTGLWEIIWCGYAYLHTQLLYILNNIIVEGKEVKSKNRYYNNNKKTSQLKKFIRQIGFKEASSTNWMQFYGEGIKKLNQLILNYPTGTSDSAYLTL